MSNKEKGKFIVFEGLDGSGKGTQINLLVEKIEKSGKTVYRTAEPTFSTTGGIIRDTLGGFQKKSEYELAALFLADRISHCSNPINGIKKYLDEGIDVICDRYYYSSFAYQGINADLKWVMKINLECNLIIKPDLCLFLDVNTADCDKRMKKSRINREIYENIEYQNKIRKRFFEVFELIKETENIKIIDASRTVDEISDDIMKIYKKL